MDKFDQPIYHDECQLVDFGETRVGGPYIKLRLADPNDLALFRGMDTATAKRAGHILHVTICKGDILDGFDQEEIEKKEKVKKTKGKYGDFAKRLRLSNFLVHPEVIPFIGYDDEYQAWTRWRKCVVCGDWDYNGSRGEKKNQFAHVRRAANAGTAHKPIFSGVPMCAKHHAVQHNAAESAVLEIYELIEKKKTNESAQEWFDRKSAENLQAFTWEKSKLLLGYKSWSEISPATLQAWAREQSDRVLKIFNLLNLIN